MRRDPFGTPVAGDLLVSVDGVVRRRLRPGDPPLTFGRSRESGTHLHVGPPNGRGDSSLSRSAGSVRHDDGWKLANESETRPFVIVVRAQRIPVSPVTVGGFGDWPVHEDDVVVELPTPSHLYKVGLHPVVPPRPDDGPDDLRCPHDSGPSTAPPLPDPTPHQRRVLAAKFLSRRQPGLAIGDERAAERVRQAHPVEEKDTTARAVMNIVGHWREKLEDLHLPDVAGRSNVDRVGAYLLAFGVLTEADRLPLPPEDDDPRL